MSLGWLSESALMPKRPKEIEDVSKASMVEMRAALYQSESAARQPDGAASVVLSSQRKRREQRVDPLAGGFNRGLGERDSSAGARDREDEALAAEAMARKVALYDAMMRGEAPEVEASSHARGGTAALAASASSLVDFELKQLRGVDGAASCGEGGGARALMSSDMRRKEERREWEATSRREMSEVAAPKRSHEEIERETGAARATANDQRAKRQRSLEERRALLRLKQEARLRATEERAVEWDATAAGVQEQAEAAEEEETRLHQARVQAAWAACNGQEGLYRERGQYGASSRLYYEYPQ